MYAPLSDDEEGAVASFSAMVSEVRAQSNENDDALLDNPTAVVEEAQQKVASKKSKKQREVPKYSWTSEAAEAMIKEWETRPLLFDCSHPQYHMKDKRRVAVEQIHQKLTSAYEINPVPSNDDIVKKMNSLRTYFNAERNKEQASKGTGKGADEIYETSWQYFEQLQFLNDNVAQRTTHSNIRKLDKEVAQPHASQPHASRKSRMKESDSSEKLAETVIDYLKRPKENILSPQTIKKSPGMLFGEIVAEIFDEIPQGYHRDMMKMEVMRVMYDTKYRSQYPPGDYTLSVQTRMPYPARAVPPTPHFQHTPSSHFASSSLPQSSQSFLSPEAQNNSGAHFMRSQDNSSQRNPLMQLGDGNPYLF